MVQIMKKKKKEIIQPIIYLPLSQIPNPLKLLKKSGDKFTAEVKDGKRVAKLHADGIKRSFVQYDSGRKVETISYI